MSALVIAHRGASGYRPEHTEAAARMAYRLGADSVETDVVATRDGVLVCRHDLHLARTTDVASRPEFADRRRTLRLGASVHTDWFVHDFTWAELSTLRCRERWPRKRALSASFDGRQPILRLCDLVAVRDQEAARIGRRLGLHVEIKHHALLESLGLPMTALYLEADAPGLTWMSFESGALRALALRGVAPGVQLTLGRPRGRELAEISAYAAGVGVRRQAVHTRDRAGAIRRETRVVAKAHKRGLGVLVWTLRAENKHLPPAFRVGPSPAGIGDAAAEARLLLDAGVNALISDHPDTVRAAVSGALAASA